MKKLIMIFGSFVFLGTIAVAKTQRLAKGFYASEGSNATVTGNKVIVEMGCAHGEFLRPSLNSNLSFKSSGTLQSEVMSNPPQELINVVYEGTVSADGKKFTITINDNSNKSEPIRYSKVKKINPLMKCQ